VQGGVPHTNLVLPDTSVYYPIQVRPQPTETTMKASRLFGLIWCTSVLQAQSIAVEAENATLDQVTVVTTPAGYSGTGAVLMQGAGSITFTVTAPQQKLYALTLRVCTSMGAKAQDLFINNTFVSAINFPARDTFFDFPAGKILMQQGSNSIEIRKSWGYMYFDKITLTPSLPNDYSTVDQTCIDANATAEARALYADLRSGYGTRIVAGQTAYWDELIALAKATPVIRAFDFQTYTVGYPYLWSNAVGGHTFGWFDNSNTQSAIDWYATTAKKGIVSFQWHWHSPTGGKISTNTFYTEFTTFDASRAVTPGTQEYTAIIRDIDSIATQLKKLQTAKVPVLFRPLHEAGGGWFWWGAKGATVCRALWDIVYERVTVYHNIHNLIWVWSSPEPEWYPGNAKVDIIGFDSYPGAFNYGSQKLIFDQLYTIVAAKKMVAMTENGPIPSIDACFSEDAPWLYFSSWADLVASQNSAAHIQEVYAHKQVVTLDERVGTAIVVPRYRQALLNPILCVTAAGRSVRITTHGAGTLSITTAAGKVMKRVWFAQGYAGPVVWQAPVAGIYIVSFDNGRLSLARQVVCAHLPIH
jgi:mannan endo-1,4-beta-mannosidase